MLANIEVYCNTSTTTIHVDGNLNKCNVNMLPSRLLAYLDKLDNKISEEFCDTKPQNGLLRKRLLL